MSWFGSSNVEADSEGVGGIIWGVEEIVKGGVGKVGVFLVNFGEHDWGHGDTGFKGGFLGGVIVVNLGEGSSEFGGADVGHDVGVVLEDQDVLLGRSGVISGRSDSDNGSTLDVWEFKLESKGVESGTGCISELELVGVLVKFEDLEDLGVNVEVTRLFVAVVKSGGSTSFSNVVFVEVRVVSPFLEGLLDGRVLFLVGGSLSGESVWSFSGVLTEWGGLIGRVESP